MTKDEATKIAGIIKTVDGGCSNCYGELAVILNEQFPEFDWDKLIEETEEIWGHSDKL